MENNISDRGFCLNVPESAELTDENIGRITEELRDNLIALRDEDGDHAFAGVLILAGDAEAREEFVQLIGWIAARSIDCKALAPSSDDPEEYVAELIGTAIYDRLVGLTGAAPIAAEQLN